MTDDSPNPGGSAASPRDAWLMRARAWPHRAWLADVLAFLWGLAEATVFFLPVEMLITYLALGNPLRALRAAVAALMGAVIGAGLLYYWGGHDVFSAMTLIAALPGLSPEVMDAAESALQQHGLAAIPAGVLSTATGKAHAVFAQGLGIGLVPFLAVFAAIRALRLLLSGCLAFCLGAMAQCFLSRRIVLALWTAAWAFILWRMFGA